MSNVQIDISDFDEEDFTYEVIYEGKWYPGYPEEGEVKAAAAVGGRVLVHSNGEYGPKGKRALAATGK
jgi:hypothetical protein